MKILASPWAWLVLLAIACAVLITLSAGCGPVLVDLPNFGYAEGYNKPEFHAGRDIEKEQGITRQAEGWIHAQDGTRYRVANGKLEWEVAVRNVTDMPRRASCSVVGSFTNYAPLAQECLTASGGGQIVLPPKSVDVIKGSCVAPNDSLQAFSRRIVEPQAAPRANGPVVLSCIAVKDGKAILSWTATVAALKQKLTVTYKSESGKQYVDKLALGSDLFDVTIALYDADSKTLATKTERGQADEKRMVVVKGRIELPIEAAADVAAYSVCWEAAKPQAEIRRMKVTAYCPCAKCCNGSADGITAWGTDAWLPGIAADRAVSFGTSISVPGYGRALVDDRGSRVRGQHLDVRFVSHRQARAWGVRYLDCIVEG